MEDIAVIGLGLRFPGDAESPEQLWKVLEKGESQWSEFPEDRLNIDGYFHPGGDRQGSISFRGAHFMKGDLAAFDAPFFSVSAEDAKAVDPQQRVLLEVSYEALENAGIRKEQIDGSDTAVYVGSFVKDYEQICLRDPDWQPQYAATGNGIAIMANRISYTFNLHGPSMTIDTGCSGSLVSVHLAAQSLRNGESSLAIAAGAGMILTPNTIMPMTALNFLSPDGKCFTFDSRANGYGRGEGIGVVVMKRLSDAIRDNDTIRAVIRGSSVNQDGRTTGITLPSKEAQVANIRSVYKSAGLSFDQTAYVECHGTGTQAGDWRELKAISETLGTSRSVDNPIVVGSVKPNIGHLEGAAGVAGLIKGVMVLEHGKIPANINFEKGNPDIDFNSWKVKVPTSLMDWPIQGLRRVSVNCFGFGGTNAHVIMDEAPAYLKSRRLVGNHQSLDTSTPTTVDFQPEHRQQASSTPRLFCFSSNEKAGVQRVIDSHIPYLESMQDVQATDFLSNYSYTLGCRRSKLEWKAAVVASSRTDLLKKMKSINQDSFTRSSSERPPSLCFVFSGQGSQWPGMGRDLMVFKAFRQSLEIASAHMSVLLDSLFSLSDEMFKDEKDSRISHPSISQPATTAIQVAMIDLLRSFGISPQHVIGHSSGEIAAAYAYGAITRESAWEIAYYRGLAAASISNKAPNLKGGMIAVGMSLEQTEEYLRLRPVGLSAEVACINSPRLITISGGADAISSIGQDLTQKGIFKRVLPVETAYHSKHMKLVESDYENYLSGVKKPISASPQNVKMFSSVTGKELQGSQLDARYWAENLVSPVNYVSAVEQMMRLPADQRPSMIVELSPRATLKTPTADIFQSLTLSSASSPVYCSLLNDGLDGVSSLLRAMSDLWVRSLSIDMKALLDYSTTGTAPSQLKCLTELPPYPWNHSKTYWHESHLGRANRFREYPRQDLIGAPTADSIPFEPRWRGFLRISENPWIQDHQVQKTIVYPAAGMISMVLEGAKQIASRVENLFGYEITNMKVEKAMIIPSTAHGLEMALNIKLDTGHEQPNHHPLSGSHEFTIYSKQLDGPWERHATGFLHFRHHEGGSATMLHQLSEAYSNFDKSCCEKLVPRQLYEHLDTVGMNYGSLFQNITSIRKGIDSCVSSIRIPDTKSKMPAKFEYPHLLHPATLDSMFQTLFAIEPVPMVPTFIKSIFVSSGLSNCSGKGVFTGYSTASRFGIGNAKADIAMQLAGDRSCVIVRGLQLTGLQTSPREADAFLPNHRNLCTEIIWKEDATFASPGSLSALIKAWAHKYPALEILQVGGSHSMTLKTLDFLIPIKGKTPCLSRYTVANLNEADGPFPLELTQETVFAPYVEVRKVDGSEALAQYHLILLCEKSGMVDGQSLLKHLKPMGQMIEVPESSHLSEPIEAQGNGNGNAMQIKEFQSKFPPLPENDDMSFDIVLLCPNEYGPDVAKFISQFKDLSKSHLHAEAIVSEMRLEALIANPSALVDKIVVSLLDFNIHKQNSGFVYEWTQPEFETFHSLQKSAKGILWITQAAQMECHNPKASMIVALARTLISEDPLKTIATFDIDLESQIGHESIALMATMVFKNIFQTIKDSAPRELEFAERKGKLYIPRLTTANGLNEMIYKEDGLVNLSQVPFCHDGLLEPKQPGLKLAMAKPGLSKDCIYFTEFERSDLKRWEVEICFDRAILSFLDIEHALGHTENPAIGMDVVGMVIGIGNDVTAVDLGFHAVGLVSHGSLQNAITLDGRFVTTARPGLVPSCFVSAYFALFHVGRARRGRTVLVHAGASSFGLAAIQLGYMAGAEVVATIFGSDIELQRRTLEQRGFPTHRIIDANSQDVVSVVMSMTKGKGVDIVYNPTQEHVEMSALCIRTCGYVVQFGNPLVPSSRKMPFTGTVANFDLSQLMREDLDFVAQLFSSTMDFLGDSPLHFMEDCPGLSAEFEIGKVDLALKQLEQIPYVGLATVRGGYNGSLTVPVLPKETTKPLEEAIDPNGTYVLAGGLGGLGRSISELLVSHGARNLAFISRSGATSDQAKEFLQRLCQQGVTARSYAVDICDQAALGRVICENISQDMPPIRGVFQCAAVIKDAVFDNMGYNDWMAAARPKSLGSWNLVEATNSISNDCFFIFLASSAGVIGNRGQANYAAGNCAEDALARWLRLSGRHAVSIDLGPVLGAGMLAEDEDILDMLRASGFYGIRHEDFLTVVEHAITMETVAGLSTPAQVTLGVGTGGLILQNAPADPYWSRTAMYSYLNLVDMPPPNLSLTSSNSGKDIKSMIAACADRQSAANIVCTGLMHMLAKAMNMLFEEMDSGKPPNAYGVDSLVAVGVRNWVLSSCGVQLSVFQILSDKTVGELAMVVAEKAGFEASTE